MFAAISTSLLPHFGATRPSELSGGGVASRFGSAVSARIAMTGPEVAACDFCSPEVSLVSIESNLARSDNGPPPLDGSRFQHLCELCRLRQEVFVLVVRGFLNNHKNVAKDRGFQTARVLVPGVRRLTFVHDLERNFGARRNPQI